MSGAPAYSCPPGVCAGPAAGRGPAVVVLCDDRRGPGATVLAHAPRPAPGRPADTGSAATQPGRRVACAVSAVCQGAGPGARLPRCGALLGPAGVTSPSPCSSGVWEPVAIQPGATALTVIPFLAASTAIARVRPTMPALALSYPTSARIAITGPVTLATMMIRPQPRRVICGSAALVTRKAVVRLRASAACQVARSIDSAVPVSNSGTAAEIIPALLTTMSSCPHRCSAAATSLGAAVASVRSAANPAASKPAS